MQVERKEPLCVTLDNQDNAIIGAGGVGSCTSTHCICKGTCEDILVKCPDVPSLSILAASDGVQPKRCL